MNTQNAWNSGIAGQGVTVAVIDAPIWKQHSQLISQIKQNQAEANGRPGVDDDNNGFVDDINGYDFLKNTAQFEYPISTNIHPRYTCCRNHCS
jgi:serine protease